MYICVTDIGFGSIRRTLRNSKHHLLDSMSPEEHPQMRWVDDGWVEPDSFAPNTAQPMGRKRRAGGRSAVRRIPDGTVQRKDNQWGIPCKRALFVSDEPDSTTSGSAVLGGRHT